MLTNITRATQRVYEYRLKLKLKSTLYIILSSLFFYHIRSTTISSNHISSLITILHSLIHSTTTKLIEAQYSEYLKND
jgi:hypothetical protein